MFQILRVLKSSHFAIETWYVFKFLSPIRADQVLMKYFFMSLRTVVLHRDTFGLYYVRVILSLPAARDLPTKMKETANQVQNF